jgi:hypothetical protein
MPGYTFIEAEFTEQAIGRRQSWFAVQTKFFEAALGFTQRHILIGIHHDTIGFSHHSIHDSHRCIREMIDFRAISTAR